MRTDTTNPQTIGNRLKEAREARGITQVQLAEAIGVKKQTVSQYEKGDRTPSLDVLNAAAEHLQFPAHRFVRALPERPTDDPLFFRSYAAATKTARTRAERRIEWVMNDICGFLRRYVDMPPVNFPTFSLPDHPASIDFDRIEEIATEVRRFWGLGDGPISDVVLLLENNGAIVVHQVLDAITLDAFSHWSRSESRPYIVLGMDKVSAVRFRLNAAHELGHMILHRHFPRSLVAHKDVHALLEEQAMYFAGAFLLPATVFASEIVRPNLKTFVMMKTRWRVAIQAMIMRAKHLGIISKEEKTRLFTYLSQRGWRKREPYDDQFELERPRIIERAFTLLMHNGLVTKASIESEVGIFARDIENAVGLDSGFFRDTLPMLKLQERDSTATA